MTSLSVHRLIYVSAARVDVTQSVLDSILAAARANNEPAGVTGLLLFHDGSFFQVLEGPKAAVERIFAAITSDNRHSGVIVLQAIDDTRRSFPNWSMGYVDAHDLQPDQQERLVDLRHLVGQEQPAELTPSPAVSVQINAFLSSFREFALD